MNNFSIEEVHRDDIAIIGYSFKFPGATSKKELWDILVSKKSTIVTIPKDRLEWPKWVDPKTTHIGIDKGGYIKDVDKFDASFFKISPREAELMDPQQRLLLELSWELFEDSGYKASSLKSSKTGVYIGASGSDYELVMREQADEGIHKGTGTSTLGAILPNRISYFFDFEGPSMLIDTACSSSLVAISEAVNSIRLGECTQAVAGGINVICHPGRSLAYYQSKMLSKDGKCYTFDERANGFVRGEGAALIFLKPLKQALIDEDRICAVIKETAVNHGGQSASLTVPDSTKQSRLIEETYRKAKIDICSVSYIEAHGTGTGLGDPIEVVGLTTAFNKLKDKKNKTKEAWCGLGSIKTNIGHLEAASGMAGLLKIVLSMEHGVLPATRNFEKLNSKLSLKNSPFYIQNESKPWKPQFESDKIRAGVSSFGLGGANGHVLLESFNKEASLKSPMPLHEEQSYLFILSAKNKERLREYVQKWLDYIDNNSIDDLVALSYILTMSRDEFEERLAIVFHNLY